MKILKILKAFLISFVIFQSSLAMANEEIQCLTVAIYKEARSESTKGQYAVAQVILNRKKHKDYPSTICKVIAQPWQFSWYRTTQDLQKLLKGSTKHLKEQDRLAYQQTLQVAQKAFYGLPEYNPALSSALFFTTKNISPVWTKKLKKKAIIGQHVFY